MPEKPDNTRRNAISISYLGGEWYVLIEEEGYDPITRTFEVESYAWNYAEGQLMRLHLDKVARI